MSRIFLSHSSENNVEAVALRDWLAREGWKDEIFLDLDPKRGLVAGARWEQALHEAADRCEAVLFLISRAWLRSRWCQKEFNLAHKLNKRLFGVIIEDLPIADLPEDMVGTWQIVRLASGRDHVMLRAQLPVTHDEAHVTFSAEGLSRLKAGLQAAGLDAKYFEFPPDGDPNRPPYRGLRPLEAEDAGIFFGRDGPTVEALDRLRGLRAESPPRLLVILGASGAGKSSFLRAGLMSRLARDDRNFLPLPPVRPERAVLTGENGLVSSLSGALKVKNLGYTQAEIRAAVNGGADNLRPLLVALAEASRPLGNSEATSSLAMPPTLVLSIDQGEELFLAEGTNETRSFLSLLKNILSSDVPRIIAIVAMRSDSYERFQLDNELEGVRQHTMSLPPLPRGAYNEVIKGPARRLEGTKKALKIEDLLTDALLADIEEGGAKDALPLLSFTLERLYLEYGDDGDLKLEEYMALGGIKGSIEAAVERAFKAADADPEIPKAREARLELLRRGLIPWLARIDIDSKSPRRRVSRLSEIPPEARPLMKHLVEQRLLATDVADDTGEITIEPAHEALLRQWGLLKGWLEEDFGALSVLESVQRASRDWAANEKSAAWLTHQGKRYHEAETLRERPGFSEILEPTDHDYLIECKKREAVLRGSGALFRFARRTVFLGPIIVSTAVAAVLTFATEIYLGVIENRGYAEGLLGLSLVLVLCFLLHVWYHSRSTAAIDQAYQEHLDVRIDLWLRSFTNFIASVTAVLPLAGFILGLRNLYISITATATSFEALSPSDSPEDFETTTVLTKAVFFYAGVIIGLLGLFTLATYNSSINKRSQALRKITLALGSAVSIAVIFFPLAFPDYVVPGAQALGPLAMTAAVLIAFVCVSIFLSYLSVVLRLPVTGTIIATALVVSLWQIQGALNSHLLQTFEEQPVPAMTNSKQELHKSFDAWWSTRKGADFIEYEKRGQKYPIFIVAAQGGGISATAATAAFLTDMQEYCGNFAQHVLAVSAVSGAAIGSAIFAALNTERALLRDSDCSGATPGHQRRKSQAELSKAILRSDHLSPVLAMIWPDIVRKIGFMFRTDFDRASILERSFACAYDHALGRRKFYWAPCDNTSGSDGLRLPFDNYWNPRAAPPALVLTSTWVETGFRAAFAPFPLRAISDGTLVSFYSPDGVGDLDAYHVRLDPRHKRSLIGAATVSTRFPGIFPAWSVRSPDRWNFVDGGYVDYSGAVTALELYQAFEAYAELNAWPISLHLIILGDADTNSDLVQVTSGTFFNDAVAPITVPLKVRDQSVVSARRRALDILGSNEPPQQVVDHQKFGKVLFVNLSNRLFSFSQSWKISGWTDEFLRLTLGKPDICKIDPRVYRGNQASRIVDVLRTRYNNSCVKQAIVEMLSGE